MNISILLPYKENFSPDYPGAVSLFVYETTKNSEYKEKITVFGGIQLGNGIGGEAKIKQSISGSGLFDGTSVDSEEWDAEDMELEYGLFLGGDYMINEKIGVRASYFKGLSELFTNPGDVSTKNNTISVSLLFNI